MAKTRGTRGLPPGIVESLTAAEQAHIDSAGVVALKPAALAAAAAPVGDAHLDELGGNT